MSTALAISAGAVITEGAARLSAAGIDEARREARLLLALALGVDASSLISHPERALDVAEQQRFAAFLARRAGGEPLSRIRGSREFWSLDFALTPATLDPRPDSETLIEAALERLPDRKAPLRLLDFGTGTGCLLLALLSELPHATGIGIDILPGAALAARRNAAALGMAGRASFIVGDWDAALAGSADVILANPPYIPHGELPTLPPEVARFEPVEALDGGVDGLGAYPALARAIRRLLHRAGSAYVEIGAGQDERSAALFNEAGLAVAARRPDLAGITRCLVVVHQGAAQ